MDLNRIPKAFQSKIRLSIIATLLPRDKTFNELKEILELSDGNLSTHLTKLEDEGYISITKEFVGKKPRSTYSLTSHGQKCFFDYVTLLENIVEKAKKK